MEHNEIGEVVRVFDRTVEIRVNPTEDCEACGVKSSCHARPGISKERFVTALDPFGLKKGQRVKISLESKNLVKASVIIFVLPLLGLLLGSVVGSFIAKKAIYSDYLDLYSIIGGFAGIGFTVLGLRSYNKKLKKTHQFYPAVVEIM